MCVSLVNPLNLLSVMISTSELCECVCVCGSCSGSCSHMLLSSSFVYCFLLFLWPAGKRPRCVACYCLLHVTLSGFTFSCSATYWRKPRTNMTRWIIWEAVWCCPLLIVPMWCFCRMIHLWCNPSCLLSLFDRWIMPRFSTMSEQALPSPPVCCLCVCSQPWLTDWPRPRGNTTWPTSDSAWPCWPS